VGFLGAGANRVGDLVPGTAVEPCVGDHLGQEPLGLLDEAGDQVIAMISSPSQAPRRRARSASASSIRS
jgi:hypothetical protein